MSIRRDLSDTSMHCFRSDHEPWNEVMRAREKADAKHGANSIEQIPADSPLWLSILTEEVGEVAHELTYDATGSLRAELIDVLSVASAWLAALDEASVQQAAMTKSDDDRLVYCTIAPVSGGRIGCIEYVRYGRSGTWWREDGGRRGHRAQIRLIDAVKAASSTRPNVIWHEGLPGGKIFDSRVRRARSAQ